MHNGEVPQSTSLRITQQTWRQYVGRIDPRGLRKLALATMFTTVALVYIGQLAMWGIFTPITPEGAQFTSTTMSTLAAATAGAFYLWRMRIPHFVEITFIAIIAAHFVQKAMLPTIYSWDISEGEGWYIIAYILFALSLFVGYVVSYIFFTGWRTAYRNKLIVAGAFVIITILLATVRSAYENE